MRLARASTSAPLAQKSPLSALPAGWSRLSAQVGGLAPARLALVSLVLVFGLGFGWLAIQRHETYRTNAEDLGFTDQAIWNFLRGQAFRFSLYEQAQFSTDINLAALKRPDSFLAFHVEPMLALLSPLYLLRSDVRLLLLLQALGWALGALPAYRLARRRLGSDLLGLGFAAMYLLAPLGQWAVLSDFHTVLLAAPLLLWAVDLLECRRPLGFLVVGLLAASTKEEVGLIVAGLGLLACWRPSMRRAGSAALLLGAGWSLLCVTLIIPRYAGTAVSPFAARYADLGASPAQAALNLLREPHLYLQALGRPEVTTYLATLLLSGGWLALLAPELLLPVVPSLALNVLSNSPWMASGRAHYSSAVLPLLVAAAVVGCARLSSWLTSRWGRGRLPCSTLPATPNLPAVPLVALVLFTTTLAYRQAGIGPLAEGFQVPQRTFHHERADRLVSSIPQTAKVSASSSLVPHLSQRSDVYLFPTLREAEYVALDIAATPSPTSAGDVYLRATELLGNGEWTVLEADDGLLLLRRQPAPTRPLPDDFYRFARQDSPDGAATDSTALPADQPERSVRLVSAELTPSGEVGPNGPLGTLHSIWRASGSLPVEWWPSLAVQLSSGLEQEYTDFAALWWYPPERWRPGELVKLEVPGLPIREVVGWRGVGPPADALSSDGAGPRPGQSATLAGPPDATNVGRAGAADPDVLELPLGELTVQVRRSSWRLSLLDLRGRELWQESALEPGERRGPLAFKRRDGSWWHLTRLLTATSKPDGATLLAATDDPIGRQATVTLTALGPRAFRLDLSLEPADDVVGVGQAVLSTPDERFLGFGERFTAVDQRGRVVTTWTDDRRVAGYVDSTYAPLPFFISSRGYSVALETDARSVFDLAAERPDRYAWEAETGNLSLVFAYGPAPRDLVQHQVARTGLPPLPPIWAFGAWKTAIGGQAQVLDDASRLRALGVPISALYVFDAVDADSNIGWPYITFEGKRSGPYGDLRALTDRLHAQGFKALTYNTADFHLDRPSYAFPGEQGFFVKAPDGQPYVHPGFQLSWLDFSNQGAVGWWGLLWKRSLVDLGFDGGMLDLGELIPEDAQYANGLGGSAMHNRYPSLYARAAFETARAHKPDSVIFARSGGAGAQAFQHLQWPGDPLVDWTETNGFKSLLPAALSFGLSGFPFWHPEVGGYLAVGLPHDSERELWFRWLQLGAFSALLRDNYGDHQTGTVPVEMWSDDETVEAYRFYARIHNRLVPYLYSYARVASETGLPLIRHLALTYPDDPRSWSEEREYTLGDNLLVAPVVDEGARTRTLYLPRGQWVDFWTGVVFDGGRDITAEAPLERIPVYARAGAIIPMATDFDTLVPAADPAIQVWNGDLVLRVMPSSAPVTSAFQLYDGTTISYRATGGRATFEVQGAPGLRGLEVHLPSPTTPSSVLIDSRPSQDWRYDPLNAEVVVSLQAADVVITLQP